MYTVRSLITRRTLVRLITFSSAVIVVLAVLAKINMTRAERAERSLEYSYLRAVEDLSLSADNISTTLIKGMYSGTPNMLSELASQLWREASVAKSAIAQLPVGEETLENTNKFLSQVGNYAIAIAKRAENGESLTLEEYANLKALSDFATTLSDDMWELERRISTGEMSFEEVKSGIGARATDAPPQIYEGFVSFEEGFDSYPTLIYDGPFSDHLLERSPKMTERSAEVTEQEALEKASHLAGTSLKLSHEEQGNMPSYVFEGENTTIGITKNGGFPTYMLKFRDVQQAVLSADEAVNCAENYLTRLEILDMSTTYHEIIDNVCTINFAYQDGDITCYTDLVKIQVALDNGEILGFETRGYLVNHYERDYPEILVSEEEARQSLSPMLRVVSSRCALIPNNSISETLTWEFKCQTSEGRNVLVYVDVQSGQEEQILILIESESGVLTV